MHLLHYANHFLSGCRLAAVSHSAAHTCVKLLGRADCLVLLLLEVVLGHDPVDFSKVFEHLLARVRQTTA